MILRLLTRGSELSRIQAESVADALRRRGCAVELLFKATRGDKDRTSPLSSFGGSGAFSSSLEEALLRGEGDGAVHSLKDLPSRCAPGLGIAATMARGPSPDVLICGKGYTLATLPPGASIGTSSPRRRAQILRLRPDLSPREIRGNVGTRVEKLRQGHYDAIVLARAGLDRLGIRPDGGEDLPALPSPCQGIVALEAPVASPLFSLGQAISHSETALCAAAERAILRRLGVGCHTPFGALATVRDGSMTMEAEILDPQGREWVRLSWEGPVRDEEDALRAGEALGELFLKDERAPRLLRGGTP